MTLLRPNFRPESWAQNAGNGISGVQISKHFRGGMPPDPPSIASISAMIPSDLRLDPALGNYSMQASALCNNISCCMRPLHHDYMNCLKLSYFDFFNSGQMNNFFIMLLAI